MRSIRAASKARWRGPGNSGQVLAISAARANNRRCVDGSENQYRLIEAAGIDKPLAHSAGHELLDLSGWDAQPGGPVGLILGDQRAGDIVAVAHAVFDGVGWRHPIAVTVKQ